jgi:hypothetical protein
VLGAWSLRPAADSAPHAVKPGACAPGCVCGVFGLCQHSLGDREVRGTLRGGERGRERTHERARGREGRKEEERTTERERKVW